MEALISRISTNAPAKTKMAPSAPEFGCWRLVLVVDETSPRGRWPKGIVQDVFPDKYGTVRHVLVKKASPILRRDVRKLCLLEGTLDKES